MFLYYRVNAVPTLHHYLLVCTIAYSFVYVASFIIFFVEVHHIECEHT